MAYLYMGRIDPRRVIFTVSLATGLSLLGDSALYTVLPTHNADAGITLATVGIILSVNRFIRVLLNGPIGLLSDRWSRRQLFVPAVFLGAASTAVYALTSGFWPLLIGRLLWGISWSGIWIGGTAIVLDISSHHTRGKWVGMYQFAFFLGAASGAFLGGLWTDWFGYHQALAVAAGITFLGAVVAWLFLPETSPVDKRRMTESDMVPETGESRQSSEVQSAVALYGINRFVVAGVFVATFGIFLLTKYGDSFPIAGITIGVATLTGLGLGFSTLIGMFAAPFAGTLSDRFHSRWGVVSGGLASGVAGFNLLAIGNPITVLLGIPLISLGSGSNQGLATTITGDLTHQNRYGRRLGLMFTIGDLASALGPILAFALIPVIGLSTLYRFNSVLLALMMIVSIRWALRSGKTRINQS